MSETRIFGYVNEKKDIGGIVFLEVVPDTDLKIVTVVAKKNFSKDAWKTAKKAKLGAAIKVSGIFPEKAVSRKGVELLAKEIEIISNPIDVLPVDPSGKTEILFDTRLEYRYFLLRTLKERAIFKIRAKALKFAREFFEERGFLEVHTPKIVGAGAEGGATLFTLDYFGRKAFLAQSPQLYKQMLMAGIPRVYEITPYFRAEKFHTTRHLNECWGIDCEIAFIDSQEDVMRVLEDLVHYILSKVSKECVKELEILNVKLNTQSKPFKRLTYKEALEILKNKGIKVEWGEDFSDREEATLGEEMLKEGHELYFIIEYPWETKPFYIMRKGELSEAFDLDYKGLEIASGGQREHRYEELVRNIKEKGLNPEDFEFYLNAFKYGMPPHGGFGLGLERLLTKMLNFSNVREVVIFPRDIQRLVP